MYPADANKQVVIVLGMHRSGTSAIAAGLEQLGLTMGSSLYQGDEWNPKGYFEERQVVEFNNKLFALCDRRWDSPLPPIPGHGEQWDACIDEAVALVQGLFGEAPAWGFKDPRMCQLAPFWGKVFSKLGVKPQLMLVVRDPAEVVHSLARRDGICVDRAAWLWMTHLLGTLEYLDIAEDVRFFAFDHLLSQPAAFLSDVAEWLKLAPAQHTIDHFARDFIAPALSHGSEARQVNLPPLVLRAYKSVRSATEEGMTPRAFRESAQWIDIENEYQRDIMPKLMSVQEFYKGDRQLSVLESRNGALSKGLAVAEKLALERLDEMRRLDAQLIQTSDALLRAEQIVLEQQSMLKLAEEQQVEAVREPDVPVAGGSSVLAHSEQRQEEPASMSAVNARLRETEALAIERLEQMQVFEAQLAQANAALARAEHVVLDQQDMIARQSESYALFLDTELIAVERLKHMQRLDAQLLEMSAALSHAEWLVAEQQEAFKLRDEMQIRFQKTEVLAFERLEEMQKLNVQLMQTTDALAHAERIVEEQQEALARAEAESVASRVEATRELVAESVQEAQKLDLQIK